MTILATIERPCWADWIRRTAPFPTRPYAVEETQLRFEANGYAWDAHGTFYSPETETIPGIGFALTHGGAGSERELHETPDGRPGLAPVLASQGFPCLALSFIGHFPPGGEWRAPVAERWPVYLLDRTLTLSEILQRNLVCSFDVHLEGMARLVDRHLAGKKLLVFGHSTGGPMMIALHARLRAAQVVGVVGWGSCEPNGWSREWSEWLGPERAPEFPIDSIARRTPESFRSAGYEDAPELCPWGGAAEYALWADRYKAQFKTSLCDNQHRGNAAILKTYAKRSGLPEGVFLGPLRDPDPTWLAQTGVLLLVGENDSRLFSPGVTVASNRQLFIAEKFATRAGRAKTVVVPRLGHFGFVGLHNERIAYCWLEALRAGFFPSA